MMNLDQGTWRMVGKWLCAINFRDAPQRAAEFKRLSQAENGVKYRGIPAI
jgi:hypothetical protein